MMHMSNSLNEDVNEIQIVAAFKIHIVITDQWLITMQKCYQQTNSYKIKMIKFRIK